MCAPAAKLAPWSEQVEGETDVVRDVLMCKWDPLIADALANEGARLHVVLDEFDLQFGPKPEDSIELASIYRISTFDSLDAISSIAVDLHGRGVAIDSVISFTEFSQFAAGLLRDLLNCGTQQFNVALLTRDKRAMKDAVRAQGVPCANGLSIGGETPPLTAAEIIAELGLPCVLKPATGMGSLSTVVCRTKEALSAALRQREADPILKSTQWIVEEYLPGTEYHVDAVWHENRELIFTVSRYIAPRVETSRAGHDDGGWVIPENEEPELHRELRSLSLLINRSLGLTSGATHCEFLEDGAGHLRFSEIASRIGGGPLVDVVSAATGIPLKTLVARESIDALDEESLSPTIDFPYSHVGWVNLAPRTAGVLADIPWVDTLNAKPWVHTAKQVRPTGTNVDPDHPSTWVVLVTFGAKSTEEFADRMAELVEMYQVPVDANATAA